MVEERDETRWIDLVLQITGFGRCKDVNVVLE